VYLAVAVNLAVRRWPVPGVVGPAASWAALTWPIGFLYARAPSRPLRRVDVFPGAGLAAGVIIGLAYAFPLYAQLSAHLSSGTEFFTVVFGLVAWVYCIAHVVLLGAVFNQSRMDLRSLTPAEAPAAAITDRSGPT
jgi:uncharacterized BrkB/YihY/UPF0761 family membrane protein